MQNASRDNLHYLLFCAGEDSGDVLGAEMVSAVKESGLGAVGSGGPLMQKAGLKAVCDYEKLPVSGFGDVLPRYFKLRKEFAKLKDALESNMCLGLVAIDYPGFNMRLAKLASKLGKPVLYVAPPQVWAWKKKRAHALKQMKNVKLAVFFSFEETAYKCIGCDVERVLHPVCASLDEAIGPLARRAADPDATVVASSRAKSAFAKSAVPSAAFKPSAATVGANQQLLLLPGSRRSTALRNLLAFIAIATQYRLKASADGNDQTQVNLSVVASRPSLEVPLMLELENIFGGQIPSWVHLSCAPQTAAERIRFYSEHTAAIASFGSCTLEMAAARVPFVACYVPDFLTLAFGRFFVKSKNLALPNIILGESLIPEFIVRKRSDIQLIDEIACTLQKQSPDFASGLAENLKKCLNKGKTLKQLMLEFLAQFLK